jgi:hypothetical protein
MAGAVCDDILVASENVNARNTMEIMNSGVFLYSIRRYLYRVGRRGNSSLK